MHVNDTLVITISFQFGADVFNALDVMENKTVFEALKFGIGDGNLHYYLYNYKCPEIKPEMVCLPAIVDWVSVSECTCLAFASALCALYSGILLFRTP